MGLDDLKKRAADDEGSEQGVTWKPEGEGDELAGTITEIKYLDTKFGETFVLSIRDEEDILWSLWISGPVLKDKMKIHAPGVGELIVVVYKGMKQGGSGYSYKNFTVIVDCEPDIGQWVKAKNTFNESRGLMDAPPASNDGITADGDDEMVSPF